MGLPHTFIQGSQDFMKYIHKLESNQSFVYYQKENSKIKMFNEFYLVNDQFGFSGLNLIHKSYFKKNKNSISCSIIESSNKIGPFSVIEKNCKIQSNLVIEDSVIMEGSILAKGIILKKSIVGKSVVVGEGAEIRNLSVIGEKVIIKPNTIINNQKITCKM